MPSMEVENPPERRQTATEKRVKDAFASGTEDSFFHQLIRPALVEFLATAIFLFLTVGHVAFSSPTGNVNEAVASVFGFSIFVLVYITASLSGGNINPAVTCALMATRRMSIVKGLLFVFSQCVGAIVGCGLVDAVLPEAVTFVGNNSITPGFSVGEAFLAEMIGTGVLILTVMAAIDKNQQKSLKHINALAPFAIGMAVYVCHLVLIPVTGCSINPARSFGASVVAKDFDDHWVFWFGPIFGGVISALIYDFILDDRTLSSTLERYKKGPESFCHTRFGF